MDLISSPGYFKKLARIMSTTTTAMTTPSKDKGKHAPSQHTSAGTTTLVVAAFAAVYVLWGSTYLAMRVGIETIPPLMLAGLRKPRPSPVSCCCWWGMAASAGPSKSCPRALPRCWFRWSPSG